MKRGLMFLLIALILLINVNVISAIVNVGNLSYSITTKYAPRDFIKGWINISLSNEPTDSLFETSFDGDFGDSISLIDLIKLNTISYSCVLTDCETAYVEVADSEEAGKNFNLDTGESKIFGFKFTGSDISINSISFTVVSNTQSSCSNQLEIDFFNDGEIDIKNNKTHITDICDFSKSYGCFNANKGNLIEAEITTTPYCQRIKLGEFPGFRLGAWVKEESAGDKKLNMSIYSETEKVATCELPKAQITTDGGEVSCDLDYLVKESKDYYICISSTTGTGMYRIKAYSDTNGCGFLGYPIQTEAYSYNISAIGKKYDNFGTLIISNEMPNFFIDNVNILVQEYMSSEYGTICPSNGCIVPIRFIAKTGQMIELKNLAINYDTGGFAGITETNFYNLTETPAKINSGFQKLSLNKANFSVPDEFGEHTFSLTLGTEEIFSEEISIEKVPQIISLRPTTVMAAYPTTFFVEVETFEMNITNYKWNFGNGDIKTTTENEIVYAYPALGKYNLTITVTSSNQVNSSKSFSIESKSPKDAVNAVLGKKLSDFSNLKTQIESLPLFYQDSLRLILNLSTIESKLAELQQKNATASSDQNYVNIMKELIELQFPITIATTAKAPSLPFYPIEESINLNVLSEIGRGNYSTKNEEKYIDAILAWNIENLETKIDFERISLLNENSEEQVLNFFNIEIEKKNTTSSPYFIIQKLENLRFKESYSSKETSGYIYIPITDSEMTITFSTTEDVDFTNIPAFISPKISELSIEGFVISEESKKWIIRFVIALGVLLFFAFIIYIILQEWYKRKYETYLFKNRNYLYNIATYIQNSKKSGIEDKEIFSKLKKAGWRSEQIRYVIRKYYGKRTGMFEIPIKKIFGVFKKKEKFEQGNFYQQYK